MKKSIFTLAVALAVALGVMSASSLAQDFVKVADLRELHTELAKQAITFGDVTPDPRSHYVETPDTLCEVVRCPFFTTYVAHLSPPPSSDVSRVSSFVIVMTLSGSCCLTDENGAAVILQEH